MITFFKVFIFLALLLTAFILLMVIALAKAKSPDEKRKEMDEEAKYLKRYYENLPPKKKRKVDAAIASHAREWSEKPSA